MPETGFNLLVAIQVGVLVYCQIDEDWDKQLVQKDVTYKCGIQQPAISASKARIINGRPTTNEVYPWLAQIFLTIPKHSKNSEGIIEDFKGHSGGTIISDRMILTCAHCICIGAQMKDRFEPDTCLSTSVYNPGSNNVGNPPNQNRVENLVHYAVGYMDLTKLKQPYDKDIKAFMYSYDKAWTIKEYNENKDKGRWKYDKNGDIAIVIGTSKSGLHLRYNNGRPICLPTLKTFQSRHINVKIAGRGRRYGEYKDVNGEIFTPCFTREGLEKRKNEPSQHIFLRCKDYDRSKRKDTCIPRSRGKVSRNGKKKDAQKVSSFSIDSKIIFSDTTPGYEIQTPKNDKCEDYFKKAKEAYKTPISSYNSPHRIVVLDSDKKDKESWDTIFTEWQKDRTIGETCYNLQKLGPHGICKTENDKYPFGFCSPSCLQPTSMYWNEFGGKTTTYNQYNELDAIYDHDSFIVDKDDQHTKYYKCSEAKFPQAINAMFRKDNKGDLEFQLFVKDEEIKEPKGYRVTASGDSGAPVWTKSDVENPSTKSEEVRHTIIAVNGISTEFRTTARTGRQSECSNIGSPVTTEIIEWIKLMDKEHALED